MLRAAVGQAVSTPGDPAANAATAARLVERAAADGARLLVLPEAFLTGYAPACFSGELPDGLLDGDALDADPAALGALDALRDAATAHGVVVLAGTGLRRRRGSTLALLVAAPGGRVVAAYDKQFLDAGEKPFFVPGAHGASVDVDGHLVGLSVCYDGSFPEHARAAAVDGAVAYAASAAFFVGSEHRRDLYPRSRALDNGLFVLFAGLTGPCGPHRFSGGSAVVDPEGRVLGRLGEEEGVVVGDLDADVVAATRAAHPMLADHAVDLGPRRTVQV